MSSILKTRTTSNQSAESASIWLEPTSCSLARTHATSTNMCAGKLRWRSKRGVPDYWRQPRRVAAYQQGELSAGHSRYRCDVRSLFASHHCARPGARETAGFEELGVQRRNLYQARICSNRESRRAPQASKSIPLSSNYGASLRASFMSTLRKCRSPRGYFFLQSPNPCLCTRRFPCY